MLHKLEFVKSLCQEVGWLFFSRNGVDTYFLSFHIVSEVMQANVEMFCSRSVLMHLRHLQCSTIVFEYVTMHFCLCSGNGITSCFHLF